ncbi:hypothetical protein RugamoR64_48680 [Duganella rhizosphaerae]|uniref:hypothetical protein n=1 Tax=Duganella rhizosphaerae TaxID=2885763 RepID=UPI0030E7F0CE
MSQSSIFSFDLASAAHYLFWLKPSSNQQIGISSFLELWDALGSKIFTVREFEREGIDTYDDLPHKETGPLDMTLIIDVWGKQPCVHLTAQFHNGSKTVGFACTLDYSQVPSDLKHNNLFQYWRTSFSGKVGMENLFDDIYDRIVDESEPVGIDSVIVGARHTEEANKIYKLSDSKQFYDIEQIDVTLSCVAKQSQLALNLPFLPMNNWDISYLTTAPGPLREDSALRTYLNATVEFGGADFDISGEFPYETIEALIAEKVAAATVGSSRRVAPSVVPSVLVKTLAQAMDAKSSQILDGLTWALTDLTLRFDRNDKTVTIEGRSLPETEWGESLTTEEISMYLDCTYVPAKDTIPATIRSATVEGIFATTINPQTSWFEAAFRWSGNDPCGSLRLARESDPSLDNVTNFRDLILKLPKFQQSVTAVYLDQPNYINKPEQRGGNYHSWPDKFRPADDQSSGSGTSGEQGGKVEPTSPKAGPNDGDINGQ